MFLLCLILFAITENFALKVTSSLFTRFRRSLISYWLSVNGNHRPETQVECSQRALTRVRTLVELGGGQVRCSNRAEEPTLRAQTSHFLVSLQQAWESIWRIQGGDLVCREREREIETMMNAAQSAPR